MAIQTLLKQTIDRWLSGISVRGLVMLVCFLITLLLGTVSIHPKLSAGSSAANELESAGLVETATVAVAKPHGLANKPTIWPTNGEVTSGFGWRQSPWGDGTEMHAGLDIANSLDTPIVATADGEVVQSGWGEGYGNVVKIDHGNGIATMYGHNARLAVGVGQKVKKGQVIAYLGSTGRSTGPHVHYEIRVNENPVDPISYLIQY